jgi:hypothetical protein
MELVEGAAQVGICLASILFLLPAELGVDRCFKQNAGKVGREKGGWLGELWELWCRLSNEETNTVNTKKLRGLGGDRKMIETNSDNIFKFKSQTLSNNSNTASAASGSEH